MAGRMTRRAMRKQLRRKFAVGDLVTWGNGHVAHPVIEITARGVIVDSTASGFGRADRHGRLTMLIEFAPGSRSHRTPGPPRPWTKEEQGLAQEFERALRDARRYPLGRG